MLGQFQFTKDMVSTKLKALSGGERARIALLKLLLEENNLLLLDEPTNHLDTDAKEALEEALIRYDGSIITVSHDRWFLDKICDTIWEVPGNGSVVVWPGITVGTWRGFVNGRMSNTLGHSQNQNDRLS